MERYNKSQREQISNFMTFTSADEATAINCLTRNSWNIERAADYYYQNAPALAKQAKGGRQSGGGRHGGSGKELFKKYSNKPGDDLGPDRIGPHGVSELLNDLRLEATNRKTLIIAWAAKAQTQCEFSREEWGNIFSELGANSIDELRNVLEHLDREIEQDRGKFREMYQFSFNYGKPERQKNMDCETAIAYWQILFRDRYILFDFFEKFLRDKKTKVITRDVWNLVFEFLEKINPDLSNYDDDGAWPTLLDNFVEKLRIERAAAA